MGGHVEKRGFTVLPTAEDGSYEAKIKLMGINHSEERISRAVT
jgi:hypothetical protein